jgi:hypothetical protein
MVGDSRVIAEHFGENVVIQRRRARLSQEELGFRADLHRTEIGMLERGIRLPRLDTIGRWRAIRGPGERCQARMPSRSWS